MQIDSQKISDLIADCAQKHLVPYFNKLTDDQIRQKSSFDDVVTQADLEMEENLIKQLKLLYPEAMCIGEESFDPKNTEILKAQALFVIDPLDGTNAFRNGSKGFAVLVSFLSDGLLVKAWMHAPLLNETIYTEKGVGVFLNGEKIIPKKVGDLATQTAVGHFKDMSDIETATKEIGLTIGTHTHACMDFLNFVKGGTDLILYKNCYPWDILAGVLIAHELGGHTALLHDEKDLMVEPFADINQATLYARSKTDWAEFKQAIGAKGL